MRGALLWSLATYNLWVYFLAVMHLRDMRDGGKLNGPIRYPAYSVLFVGYVLDAAVNLVPASLVFWELPQLLYPPRTWPADGKTGWRRYGRWEWTVSERTGRLAETSGWRGRAASALRRLFLAPADKSGGHG